MNPFYDTVQATSNVIVPSKQVDYKRNADGLIIVKPPTQSVREFEAWFKEDYLRTVNAFEWPLRGPLFFYAKIGLTKRDYTTKDLDNIAKVLIDPMKSIVFEDDSQISILLMNKIISEPHFVIAIKELTNSTKPIFSDFQEPISLKPYPKKNITDNNDETASSQNLI